jgi:hypothetical protein
MPWNEVLSKYKAGALKSGGTGKTVSSRPQAIAIMLSEKKKADEGKEEYKPLYQRRTK